MTKEVAATNRWIRTGEDVLRLLDAMFDPEADRWSDRGAGWWDGFYDDRDRPIPFFRPVPDESLVGWHESGRLDVRPGARALELGCGPGRNSIWLAGKGYRVDALDLSGAALAWGRERATAAAVEVNFVEASIFDWAPDQRYDLVYDSGCFHHLPPHRRISYRSLLERSLAPGAAFGLGCFAAGAMGAEEPDQTFYREGRLAGGLAYSEDDLRAIFDWLSVRELRPMRQLPPDSELFGEAFLWAGLFCRTSAPDR